MRLGQSFINLSKFVSPTIVTSSARVNSRKHFFTNQLYFLYYVVLCSDIPKFWLEMENSDSSINSTVENCPTAPKINELKDEDIHVNDKANNNEQCKDDPIKIEILDEIKNCPAIFQSQQIGEPELTTNDKRRIAEELFCEKPVTFLLKFGEFLKEEYLNYFLNRFSTSYEVQYYVKNFKSLLNEHNKKIIKRNRRYEAMKRMEAEGNYFSETEMEKREPLLYHQMVGQYLSEKERHLKNLHAQEHVIPTFSNFLINKMEREEINNLIKSQQEEEDKMENLSTSSEEVESHYDQQKHWGEDWEEKKSRKKIKKKLPKKPNDVISKKEKLFLLQEFQSIMKNNFLNGKDPDFNYSEVDLNPDYDSVDLKTQDEEEKYFDEETYDTSVCTDTGIEDY